MLLWAGLIRWQGTGVGNGVPDGEALQELPRLNIQGEPKT